ncbi:hypothetical protein F4810DRAFT_670573 [Camillea tinctor]|nr:hypothetical protein F4810DRAFT_670573 [Camillea tinctor]
MALKPLSFFVLWGYLFLTTVAICTSYGVDYSNGGSYNIDTSLNENFTFTSIFQRCDEELINPVLVDPAGQQYACSTINTTPQGSRVISTCDIPYSSMSSGIWKIILSGIKIAAQRVITLTAKVPGTVTVIATPTIIIGITSTPEATTTYKTIATQTQTLILAPVTITAPCSGLTQTITITPKASTSILTSTIVRTSTDRQITSYSYTTITKTAYCHYLTTRTFTPLPSPTFCIGDNCSSPWNQIEMDTDIHEMQPFDQNEERPESEAETIAATTITVTETTFTVTSTSITTAPPETKTESVTQTTTATM